MSKLFNILFLLLLSVPGEALTLQWTYPENLGISIEKTQEVEFHIYRQDNCEGHYFLIGKVQYPQDNFKDTSAMEGKTYCYIVTTVHGNKESSYGNYIRVEGKE